MKNDNTLRVLELFAGVGGFRLGLKEANPELFEFVWGNQWEPSRKSQDAYECYAGHFGREEYGNTDIAKVPDDFIKGLDPSMVVGGFPCQDYSVARTLSGERGIEGKKGVLFWEIKRVLELTSPKYVLLENVDRLLKSPASQRGRDFAVMLATFRDLNYSVEWRVINAAEYGFPQRRRRVFIFAYKNGIPYEKDMRKKTKMDMVFNQGFFTEPFPVESKAYKDRLHSTTLPDDIVEISNEFTHTFHNAGIMRNGEILTAHVVPIGVDPLTLGDILIDEKKVDARHYLSQEAVEKFAYLRGPKRIERTSVDGHSYVFSEGGMSPVDDLDKPGRTMLTSEGSINRSTHIVEVKGRKRFLTPVECERLNGFPDGWTASMGDRMRYFCMGNALVVGLIEIMGRKIAELERTYEDESIQLDFKLN